MAHEHLMFRSEAREKILRGATAIADAMRVTLGPKSRCVLIEKKWRKPVVCNDGVTIAKEFALKDGRAVASGVGWRARGWPLAPEACEV